MKATCFLDTNILLYRASTAEAELPKRLIAETLLRRPDIGLSAQVLAEFYHSAVHKPGLRLPLAAARELSAATVFSEDLNHGQIYDGVTVLNPFLPGFTPPEE